MRLNAKIIGRALRPGVKFFSAPARWGRARGLLRRQMDRIELGKSALPGLEKTYSAAKHIARRQEQLLGRRRSLLRMDDRMTRKLKLGGLTVGGGATGFGVYRYRRRRGR